MGPFQRRMNFGLDLFHDHNNLTTIKFHHAPNEGIRLQSGEGCRLGPGGSSLADIHLASTSTHDAHGTRGDLTVEMPQTSVCASIASMSCTRKSPQVLQRQSRWSSMSCAVMPGDAPLSSSACRPRRRVKERGFTTAWPLRDFCGSPPLLAKFCSLQGCSVLEETPMVSWSQSRVPPLPVPFRTLDAPRSDEKQDPPCGNFHFNFVLARTSVSSVVKTS